MKSTFNKGEIYYKGHFLYSLRVVVLHVSKKKKSKKVIYLAMNWWIYASIGRNEIYHNIQSCGSDKGFLFWYDVLLPSGQR